MSPEEAKKEVKSVSFEEGLERNFIITIAVLILLIMLGLPVSLSVVLAILITLYINHLKNKK
jgi:hypothetical protein